MHLTEEHYNKFSQPDEGKEVFGIQICVPTFMVFYNEMAHTFLIGYVGLQKIRFKFSGNYLMGQKEVSPYLTSCFTVFFP